MSSTGNEKSQDPIFLNDTFENIKLKIKHSFSGGGATKKEHIENGADLLVDIPYQYLMHFLHDDEKLKDAAEKYGKGIMLTSEIKNITSEVIYSYITNHAKNIDNISDIIVKHYLDYNKFKNKP